MSLVKVVRDEYDANTVREQGWELRPVPASERPAALRAKLMEEVSEYLEDGTIEELADVLEVLVSLVHHIHRTSFETLHQEVEKKREKKGGLARVLGLYLEPPEGVR